MSNTTGTSDEALEQFRNYPFVGKNSKSYSETKTAGVVGLERVVEFSLLKLYEASRELQVAAKSHYPNDDDCFSFVEEKLRLKPKTARTLIKVYSPFIDPTDKSKFPFYRTALASLGMPRLLGLGPIIKQLFTNPNAAFCRHFWVSRHGIDVFMGNNPNIKSNWRDFREIPAKDIPDYYHLADLDRNGKPLRLPEPEPEPVSKYAVPGPDFDDIDFYGIDDYDRRNNDF